MAPRLNLHNILRDLCDNVYFQPPANVKLVYPAIVYSRDAGTTEFADNTPYSHEVRYQITVIDKDPDNDIQAKVALLPKCLRNRGFAVDNLNHDVFNIYF